MAATSKRARGTLGWLTVAVAVAVASGLAPGRALACGTCTLGDPTLTTFGLGQPFAQRLRLGARYELRTTDIGSGTADAYTRREQQAALLMAYTPLSWLTVDADLPLAHVQVDRENAAEMRATNLGDASVGARMQMLARKARGRHQSLWASARLVLPTAPELTGDNDAPLPIEEQTGAGAFGPQLGLGYAHTGGPFGAFVTARAELPSRGFAGSRPSRGVYATVAGQWQPRYWFGVRLAWEQGYEVTALDEGGVPDPDSGGVLWNAGLTLLFAPTADLVISIGGQVPVWQHLDGRHQERPVALASLIYDLGND